MTRTRPSRLVSAEYIRLSDTEMPAVRIRLDGGEVYLWEIDRAGELDQGFVFLHGEDVILNQFDVRVQGTLLTQATDDPRILWIARRFWDAINTREAGHFRVGLIELPRSIGGSGE